MSSVTDIVILTIVVILFLLAGGFATAAVVEISNPSNNDNIDKAKHQLNICAWLCWITAGISFILLAIVIIGLLVYIFSPKATSPTDLTDDVDLQPENNPSTQQLINERFSNVQTTGKKYSYVVDWLVYGTIIVLLGMNIFIGVLSILAANNISQDDMDINVNFTSYRYALYAFAFAFLGSVLLIFTFIVLFLYGEINKYKKRSKICEASVKVK